MANLVKKYTISIDGQEAVASVGQLRGEVKRLEEELDKLPTGSKEAEQALLKLGRAKAALTEIDEAIDGLQIKNRAAAITDFAGGLVGLVGVATAAGQAFGLSSKTVAEYEQKMQTVLTVTASLEAIQKAANGETLAGVKNLVLLAKSHILGGEAASTASKVTRGALAATGIGLLIIAIAVLYANWDKVTVAVTKFKEEFMAGLRITNPPLAALVDKVTAFAEKVGGLRQLLAGVLSGAAAGFKGLGSVIASVLSGDFSAAKKQAAKLGGEIADGFNQGVAEKSAEIAQEAADALLKGVIEARDRRIKVVQAEGKDTYAIQRKNLQDQLSLLKQDTEENIKLYKDKFNEIEVLDAAHGKKLSDEAKAAAEKAKAERQKEVEAEYQAFLKRNQELEKQEIITAEERLRRDREAEAKRLAQLDAIVARDAPKAVERANDIAKTGQAKLLEMSKAPVPFEDTFLIKVLGVRAADVDKVKAQIQEAYQAIAQIAQEVSDAIFSSRISEVDAQLAATQDKISLIGQQLQASQSATEKAEAEIGKSSGARRDYYIQQLQKQRAETDRLNVAKKKAAEEEKQQLKEQQQLQKESQRVSLALTAVKAVEAAISAIAGAADMPFPASIPAIIIAGATVAGAVIAGKGLADSFEQGGVVNGPRHSQGGIQLWHRNGAHLGEMEGGEYIINRAATAKNRPLLDMINEAGRTRVLAPPANTFADGGVLGGAVPTPVGTVLVQTADLAELVATNKQMLARLDAVAASNAQIANYGPPRIVRSYQEVLDDNALLQEAQQASNAVRL